MKVTLRYIWANQNIKEPQQGLEPTGKYHQGKPMGVPGIRY
jgi:hypothetical protein